MIRVLVAEDSAVTRELFVAVIREDPGFEVVAAVADGLLAVEQAERLRPDVILMDIHMPNMDGLEATRRIMARAPTRIVLASASFVGDDTTRGFEAIRAGALTLVGKPPGPGHPDHARSVRELLQTLRVLSEVAVVRRWPAREPTATFPRRPNRIRLVAVGASTGGPAALAELLGELDAGIGAPMLVVQHITPGFTAGLVQWLAGLSRLRVKLAEAGELAQPGSVYVAPDGRHMGVSAESRIRLETPAPGDTLCPSASYLFESVTASHGASAMGVLLTGMGRDGVAELSRLRAAGGVTVAQDEASSVVFGMPGEAVRVGAAEHVLPPKQIARLIRSGTGAGA